MVTTGPKRAVAAAIGVITLAAFGVPAPTTAQTSPGDRPAVVGPEQPVTDPLPGFPRTSSQEPAVAYGDGVFLVAWIGENRHLWVARVDQSGAALDQSGIRLSTALSERPSVTFDGENFLVVWDTAGPVQARRVSPAGAVLDDQPIDLSSADAVNPQVSFGGGNHLVVWSQRSGDAIETADVYGTRVSPEGAVLDPTDVPIVAPEGAQLDMDIAFNGTHHLLVWDDWAAPDADVHGTLVTTDRVAVDPGRPIASAEGSQRFPVVTAVGASFFVAWAEDDWDFFELFGARVGADGSVIDDPAIPIATAYDVYRTPDVSSDGTNALVTWTAATGKVLGTRVDPTGELLDPSGADLGSGFNPVSTFGNGRYFVAFSDGARLSVEATRVTPDLVALDPEGVAVAIGALPQRGPFDMAFDGTNHLVVWNDGRSGRSAVYGARVGPDGQRLDGSGFPISTPTSTARDADGAAIAFDGTNFLVVWRDGPARAISAARVTRSGEVLNQFVVAVDDAWGHPSVSFGHGVFLITWDRQGDGIIGARVDPTGKVLDEGGFPISRRSGYHAATDIAAGGSEFLVVWTYGPSFGPYDVYGAVVSPSGNVLNPEDIPISNGRYQQQSPAVAWQDGTYLVAWQYVAADDPSISDPHDIYGARVDGSGTVLDPVGFPIATAPDIEEKPDVSANGRFLVTWNDRRWYPLTRTDVRATTVGLDGSVRPAFAVSASDELEDWATTTAAPGAGNFAVAYGRFAPEQPYATDRAFLRQVAAPK
jgi:hypothetical protein